MIFYRLAETLGVDIDVVLSWPYDKIRNWLAYFVIKEEEMEKEKTSGK